MHATGPRCHQDLDDFFTNAPIGIFITTPEGRYLYANPALARMYGYASPRDLMENVSDIALELYADPADRREYIRLLEQHGQVSNHESRRLRRDGSVFWVSLTSRVVRDDSGDALHYQGFTIDITHSKYAQEDLLVSEARNRALLKALPDMVFLLDREGFFLAYHGPRDGLLTAPGNFLGRHVFDVLPQDIAKLALLHIEQVAGRGGCVSWGYTTVLNGETKSFECRMTACGEHYLAVNRDVSERKKSQQRLKEQAQLLDKITENMSDVVMFTSLEGKISFSSNAGRFLGHAGDFLLGRNIMDLVHPEDKPNILAAFDDFIAAQDGTRTTEVRYRRAGGGYVWGETIGRFVFDQTGVPKEILFSIRDVTDRKAAETALVQRNADLRAAERLARMGSWKYDLARNVFTGSEEAYRIMGLKSRKEIAFDRLLDLVHVNDRAMLQEIRDTILHVPRPFDLTLRIVAPGGLKWIRVIGDVTVMPGQGVTTAMGMIMDITEKKELEIKQAEQQEQLVQASKMTALGTLVAGVAHEINNPNNLIMLNAPILEKVWADALPVLDAHAAAQPDFTLGGIPFAQMREYVGELFSGINEGSQRITKIITELKDFVRQSPVKMNDLVDLSAVVRSSLSLMRKTVSKSTDRLRVTLAPDLPLVRGDFHKLEQVVINVLINACQALTSREQGIEVQTGYGSSSHAVSVIVADQGEGICPEHMSRIRDPFFSTRHSIGGTGLGLSISSTIVEDHQGDMRFDSTPGQGTVVTISLPVSPPSFDPKPSAAGESEDAREH